MGLALPDHIKHTRDAKTVFWGFQCLYIIYEIGITVFLSSYRNTSGSLGEQEML